MFASSQSQINESKSRSSVLNKSHCSVLSHNSIMSHSNVLNQCPNELYGYVYDIPKDLEISNKQLQEVFAAKQIKCEVQIIRKNARPSYSATVKFSTIAHQHMATEKMRFFGLQELFPDEQRNLRYLPFNQSLQQAKTLNKSDQVYPPTSEYCNMPDNSNEQCNVFVKDLDEILTSQDLYNMFISYGEIRSVKVSTDASTGMSKGFGFVWFNSEHSAATLIKDSESRQIAFRCELYQNAGYRRVTNAFSAEFNQISVKGYPSSCGKKALIGVFSQYGDVVGCQLVRIGSNGTEAHITFKSEQSATRACLNQQQTMFDQKITVTPVIQKPEKKDQQFENSAAAPPTNNLYVQNIAKTVDEFTLRKFFAMCGQISSIKLIRKKTYPTDIAYVAYKNSLNAQFALDKLNNFSLGEHCLQILWHKSKEDLKLEGHDNIQHSKMHNVFKSMQEANLLDVSQSKKAASKNPGLSESRGYQKNKENVKNSQVVLLPDDDAIMALYDSKFDNDRKQQRAAFRQMVDELNLWKNQSDFQQTVSNQSGETLIIQNSDISHKDLFMDYLETFLDISCKIDNLCDKNPLQQDYLFKLRQAVKSYLLKTVFQGDLERIQADINLEYDEFSVYVNTVINQFKPEILQSVCQTFN